MRVIVTGSGGFIGSYLVAALQQRGDTVQGWTRSSVDITDSAAVLEALKSFAPDTVIHLAAQSLPTRSWEDPAATYRVNVGGTINLFEAIRHQASRPRMLLAGSSAEYAEPVDGKLIAEDAPLNPNSPYASSKLAADGLARLYGPRYDMNIVRFRPFWLVGPGKIGDVCSDFAARVVAIERGADSAMRVGDLTGVRDMMDVRDGIIALLALVDSGVAGAMYNICSGKGTRIGAILDIYRNLSTATITIAEDPALLRPLDHKIKIGDPAKLQALGWSQTIAIEATLAAILNHARAQR